MSILEPKRAKLLLVEDNPGDARLIQLALRSAAGDRFDLEQVDRLGAALARLDEGGIQLILLDLTLPDSHGLDTVAAVRAHQPQMPIVVLTGLDDESLALKALEIGAQDYLVKGDLDGRALSRAIRYAIERQQVERALRQSEARFRGLLASAPDAILIVNREGRITFTNDQVEKTFGYRPNELVGETIELLVPERARERHSQHRLDYMAAPSARPTDSNLELRGRRQDGSEFDADIMLGPVEQDGELSVLCIVRDVTDRRAAEAALTAKTAQIAEMTQQLWQAAKLATMGELAASIAHELNNPLATVSLRVEILLAQLPSDDPKRRGLEVAQAEVERMARLVANLLQFSRRGTSQISTLNVHAELANTLDLVAHHLRSHQVVTVPELATEALLIRADRQQLRQVFLNLFTNAADAMPRGGTLTIRTRAAAPASANGPEIPRRPVTQTLGLPVSRSAPQAVIEISDTGEGIPPDAIDKVWEPFYTTKPEGKGTGLGLAICRRIVQEHGGTIEITSAGVPGQGTTIRLTLPAAGGAA